MSPNPPPEAERIRALPLWSATVGIDGSLHMAWLAVAGAQARQLDSESLAELADSAMDHG